MLGAIIGDEVGSIFEHKPIKTKDFEIFDLRMKMTDDSALTCCVARTLMKHYPFDYSKESILEFQNDLKRAFIKAWRGNSDIGFGMEFFQWCRNNQYDIENAKPYNSYGNGSAMRISPVGWIAKSEEEVKKLSKIVTEITHNHPEGLKGAEAVAMSIYLALHGASKEEIKDRMIRDYYPRIADLDFDVLIKTYTFIPTCEDSVPEAIYCFLISSDLEDAIRNCVAIGGDCDTTGAMAGAIAEAYYQKDKLSSFEDNFLYLMIGPNTEKLIKDFHLFVNSKKFLNASND